MIWNKQTNNVVGGHQRLTVLENEGETEVDVSVVDLDPMQSGQLNVALTKSRAAGTRRNWPALLSELGTTRRSRASTSRRLTASPTTSTA